MERLLPTCFITHQPVLPGERCVVLPVIQRASIRERELSYHDWKTTLFSVATCRNRLNAFWTPFAGFLEMTFTGGQSFLLAQDQATTVRALFFLNALGRLGFETGEGPNAEIEPDFRLIAHLGNTAPLVLDEMDSVIVQDKPLGDIRALLPQLDVALSYVLERILSFRVFAHSRIGGPREVQFALLRGDVFDALVAFGEELTTPSRIQQTAALELLGLAALASVEGKQDAFEQWMDAKQSWEGFAPGPSRTEFLPFPVEEDELVMARHRVDRKDASVSEFVQALEPMIGARYAFAGIDAVGAVLSPITFAQERAGASFASLLKKTRPT